MSESVSHRVIERTAAASETDPLELPPLNDTVDPDALEALITRMTDGRIVFYYAGYEVTVESDETVRVDGQYVHQSPTSTSRN